MTLNTLIMLRNCTSETEARIKCDLVGEHFDRKQYREMMKLDEWEKTLWLYKIDCKERGIYNVLN